MKGILITLLALLTIIGCQYIAEKTHTTPDSTAVVAIDTVIIIKADTIKVDTSKATLIKK